jgi:RimJ/RimL family protein N-acetyltransferase
MHPLLLNLPTRLETARLVLRPYQAGDGPVYYEVCRNNQTHLLPYEADNPACRVSSEEDAEILVRQWAADWVTRHAFVFGAWDKGSGAFVAQIYVGCVNWDLPEFELGYFVDKAHEGQGFVTEAAQAVLGFIFGPLAAHRIRLRCSDTNARSYHVAERCGFRREGHLRQTDPRFRDAAGDYGGELFYGLLRAEFLQHPAHHP